MIFLKNKDLIECPHKTLNFRLIFDFIKNRVKISLCESKICFKPIISNDLFLTKLL